MGESLDLKVRSSTMPLLPPVQGGSEARTAPPFPPPPLNLVLLAIEELVTDHMAYERRDSHNRLTLTKRL